jgi:hypothetical protein
MNEKKEIEKATAEAFIKLYNSEKGTTYIVVEHSEAPDIKCIDSEGNKLGLEITLTEDRPGDIPAIIGRSDALSLPRFKYHRDKVKAGEAKWLERVSHQDDLIAVAVSRIQPKLKKDYGPSTALVVRDTSAVCWDWDHVTDQIKESLDISHNPFDKGIWIISYRKDRIFQII